MSITVFAMHLLDPPKVCSIPDHIVIELVVCPNGSNLGARELAQWMEEKVVDDFAHKVRNPEQASRPSSGNNRVLCPEYVLNHGMP